MLTEAAVVFILLCCAAALVILCGLYAIAWAIDLFIKVHEERQARKSDIECSQAGRRTARRLIEGIE